MSSLSCIICETESNVAHLTCCRQQLCIQCCFYLTKATCPYCRHQPMTISLNEQIIQVHKPKLATTSDDNDIWQAMADAGVF